MEDNNQNGPSTSSFRADYHLESEKVPFVSLDMSDDEGESAPSKKKKTYRTGRGKGTSSGTYAHTSKNTSSYENFDKSDNEGESAPLKKRKTYRTGRVKRTLHGNDYQLKLLMLFAWEAGIVCKDKNSGVKFSLATEKVDSEWDEFDDLIFRYEDNGKINYRFLQAKHSYSGDKIIKINDLLSESDSNNYSLQKYFKSYLIYDQKYKDGDLEDLIICSNYKFDSETTENYLEEKPEADPVLNLGGKIYHFKKSKKGEIIEELKPIFEEALLENRKTGKKRKGKKEKKRKKFLDYLSEKTENRDKSSLESDCLDKIGDFLDKLVFAVEQPSGAELEEEIAYKIGNEFNLVNNGTYSQFYKFMFNWMQNYEKTKKKETERGNMEARFLTNDDLKIFIDKAKQEVASLGMISSNLFYEAKMKTGIRFNEEIEELKQIKNFLKNEEKQILKIINHSNAFLSGIKVYQVLENCSYKSDEYIFSDLKSLSILNGSAVDPLTAFKSSARNLLITEHDSTVKEYSLRPFIKVLKENPKKKVILITSKEHDHRIEKTRYVELEDKSNNLTDLSDESQKRLLKKEGSVIFQGKQVTLNSLIEENNKHLISGQVLCMIINNEKLEIGKEIVDSNYNEIKEQYIDRKLSRNLKISKAIAKETSKFFIINDNEESTSNPEDNRDILLISDNVDLFMKLCNDRINRNIHLLRKEGNEFVWQQSRGDLSHLRTFSVKFSQNYYGKEIDEFRWRTRLGYLPYFPTFIDKDSQNVTLFGQDSINDKEVIIVSEPGMGKSILLTRIALQEKESHPCLLVLNIKLVEYSAELNKLKTDNNNEAKINFLYKTFLKKYTEPTETFLNSITITTEDHKIFCIKGNESKIDDVSWLEVQLFNEFYNNGKVIFYFDGFDEICPDYKEAVIELLKVLKGSRSRIWITTRPYNISEELENKLGVFPYCLEGFSKDEQLSYLKKFWSVDGERSDIYVNWLLYHLFDYTEFYFRDFLGIPLHLNMLAVVFEKEFKDWYDSGVEQFSISDDNKERLNNLNYLYEKFIDIQFSHVYIKEKNSSLNTDEAATKLIVDKIKVEFLNDHKMLAAYSLLNEIEVKLFLSEKKLNKMSKKIEDIKFGKEKTGIISHVADNKPVFVHRTIAEYFLSHFVYDKLKTDSDADSKVWEFLIKQILIKNEYFVIRRFLNSLFADYKVDNIKSEIIKKLLKDFIKVRDGDIKYYNYYVTPLQVACNEGLIEIVRLIIDNQPDGLENVSDKYFVKGLQPSSISDQDLGYCRLKIVEKNFINLAYLYDKPLELAVLNGNEGIVRLLLDNGACITCKSVYEALFSPDDEKPIEVLLDYVKSDRDILWFMRIILLEGHFSERSLYQIEILEMLIKKLDNVNIKDEDGNTPLHAAAMVGRENIDYLLLDGFDIEYQGRETSPIISKMVDTCDQVRSYLLDRGVIVKNNEYYETKWVRTVKLLLEKGADENILNNNGKRPIDLVPDFNDLEDYDLDYIKDRIRDY